MPHAKDSSITDPKSKSPTLKTSNSQQQQQQQQQHRINRTFMMAQDILRILPTLLSAAAIAVMVTNNQIVLIFGIRFEAHFYYSSSLKFFVAANGVVAAMSLLTLILNFLIKHQTSSPRYQFFLFLHDMVMTVLLIAGCAAASAIGYVVQYGEEKVGWQPMCNHVRKFCRTNLFSLLLSYFAFLAYFGLTILSAYKILSSSPKN